MPRWTSNFDEIKKLSTLPDFWERFGLERCRIHLTNSVVSIEGVVLPARVGNTAGIGGRWEYYGSIVIRTDDDDIEVDFLDVDRAELL